MGPCERNNRNQKTAVKLISRGPSTQNRRNRKGGLTPRGQQELDAGQWIAGTVAHSQDMSHKKGRTDRGMNRGWVRAADAKIKRYKFIQDSQRRDGAGTQMASGAGGKIFGPATRESSYRARTRGSRCSGGELGDRSGWGTIGRIQLWAGF